MFKDWFKKRFSKADFERKDRFLTGIQKIEYTKEDQIRFTCDYYRDNMKQKIAKVKNLDAVVRRLNKYQIIMNVEL